MDFSKKKIISVVELLSTREIGNLEKFISSPYHVKVKEQGVYLKLLRVVKAMRHSPGTIDEQALYHRLYPSKPFVSGKIDKKMTQLIDLTLEFLGWENVKNGPTIKLAAQQSLREKGADKLYVKERNKLLRKRSQEQSVHLDTQLRQFELDLEEFRFINADPFKISQDSHDLLYDSLDNLYLHYFLEVGIRNLAYNRFIVPLELKSRFDNLESLLDNRKNEEKNPELAFKEEIFRILKDRAPVDENIIEELSQKLEHIKKEINIESYKNYRTIIRNFIVIRYNAGENKLGAVLFMLYKTEVENGHIFYQGKVPSAVVNNISFMAIREKESKWLLKFLQDIEGKILEPQLGKFTLALNHSKLLFAQSKFNEVLDCLIFDVKEIHLKVYARTLELMAYFELHSDQLTHKLEAYKIFVYRLPGNKLGKDFIDGHINFCGILKSLMHPSTAFDLKRIVKLKNKIGKTRMVAEKGWLLEKIEQLEDKNK